MMRTASVRLGFVDKPGGRKIHENPKPLGGGVGIFWAMAVPMIAGLVYVSFFSPPGFLESPRWLGADIASRLDAYWSGIRERTPLAFEMLLAGFGMHLLGLADDRKAMGPYFKLLIQLSIITALVAIGNLRVLTFLDHALPGGRLISIVATVLWIGAITNAFNFLDNMDGLSAGVAAVCATAFLVAALSIGQWFVASALALLLGAILGFLWHNFPPARIFMGDSGSLLIGFFLGVLTVLTTYLPAGATWQNDWYAIFAPVVVLALPLYDLVVVSAIRILRGKNPFVGDTNHFSHRLVHRGMSRRTAVLCLYLVAAATSVGAIILPHVNSHFALLILLQTLLILCVVALLEQHPMPMATVSPVNEAGKAHDSPVAPGGLTPPFSGDQR
ncbi:MAG: undecaprenyl/decaprenyl-phosphate alpha-N-acetylglucosaminyl 1-phosphate transferase [Planctomycetota bacterium]|nr:undecaprenyl/decaprenyl-phosphate alpha-N-acetylglucosaminyl 1-phosphate transferase [Planctomycetota bacterium]